MWNYNNLVFKKFINLNSGICYEGMKQLLLLNIPMYQIINYFKDPIKKNLSICTYICDFKKNQLPLTMHIKHEFSFD